MKKNYIVLLLCTFVFGQLNGQTEETKAKPPKYRKTMPIYLEFSAGINTSKFIDFGTSPLYYKGPLKTFSLAYHKTTDLREVFYSALYSFGNYTMDYNEIVAKSKASALSIRHSRLFKLDVMKSDLWNLKVGGTLDVCGIFRQNPSLLNNGIGLDMFVNLFASGKLARNVSNKELKKLWFVKIKPKERTLAYQLDFGLVNGGIRNNYIYSNSTPVYNDANIIGGSSFKLFSGFRISSRFDYEHAIFGNNTLKYSYIWDAMMSSNKDNLDRLQLVNKVFLVSLNIKLR